MIPLTITPDIEQSPWFDLLDDPDLLLNEKDADGFYRAATIERAGLLRHGTTEGRATLELMIRLPNGRVVLAETTVRLARLAVAALAASPVMAEETED